jgi:hypothetical protein
MHATRLVSAAALVLLSFAGTASAVTLDPHGLGQALIYPYYTVNRNQDTLVSVVNASGVSKAVQMRFREGYNARVVLQFVLFLSPHDVWTASLSSISDDGGVLLRTSDRSCTDPAIPAAGVSFRSADYDGTGPVPADGGPTSITRTREGFMEFIAADDLVAGSPTDVAITHVQTGQPGAGVPADCDAISAAWDQTDVAAPSGAIYGSAAIVNVGQGTFFPYVADAISGFTSIPLSPYADGAYPLGVSLADANSSEAVAGVATAYVTDNQGRPLALDYAFGIDAVSAVYMADAIHNEYIVAPSLGANTDWVVTLPTRSFYVDPIYGQGPLPPFVAPLIDGSAAVDVSGFVYDREEGGGDEFGHGCGNLCPPSEASLSYQVNVIPVANPVTPAAATGVFGSALAKFPIPPYGDDGQIVMHFDRNTHFLPGGVDPDGGADSLVGVPVTGFMAYNVINTNAQPGLLANYSGVFRHRSTTSCLGDSVGCTPINSGATP